MSKHKVLVIEDELIIAIEIKNIIEGFGFEVIGIAKDYSKSLELARKNFPDIIVADINLKKSRSGIESSSEICRIKKVPIIYLTAYSDEKTIKEAALTNPTSYILKPFREEDIEVALKLAVCKMDTTSITLYVENLIRDNPNFKKLGLGYIYDVENSNLYYKNIPVRLGKKERMLLEMLICANGNVVPFSTIETVIWNDEIVSENIVRVLLYRLRTKLEHKLIETIPSFRCRLVVTN